MSSRGLSSQKEENRKRCQPGKVELIELPSDDEERTKAKKPAANLKNPTAQQLQQKGRSRKRESFVWEFFSEAGGDLM